MKQSARETPEVWEKYGLNPPAPRLQPKEKVLR